MRHILRAHQLCNEGYQVPVPLRLLCLKAKVLFNNRLSTVWSAPNYCYRCGNRASICEVSDNGSMSFNVFDESPENQIVIKEQQQTQAKVRPQCRHFLKGEVGSWLLSVTTLDAGKGKRFWLFMALPLILERIGIIFTVSAFYTRPLCIQIHRMQIVYVVERIRWWHEGDRSSAWVFNWLGQM